MIQRTTYLEQLREFIDKPQIKILTGIRRSGKSSALLLLKDELKRKGVETEQIVYINLESFVFSELRTAAKLY
jgi:predicted AAA+ superfamily ATPase